MKKANKILIVAVMVAVAILSLVGCSNNNKIDYVNDYKQVIYDMEEEKFMPTGNKISIHEDYTFTETYRLSKGEQSFSGSYV